MQDTSLGLWGLRAGFGAAATPQCWGWNTGWAELTLRRYSRWAELKLRRYSRWAELKLRRYSR
ncbi:MAG TPA: hypothetical protein VIE40_05265, partial [Dehalococcoidia bacterium]